MKKYTEKSVYHNQDRPKQRGDYAASRARYKKRQREDTERRQRINPRLVIGSLDYFDLLMEQDEQ